MGRLILIILVAAAIGAVLKVVLIGIVVAMGIILIYGFLTAPFATIAFILSMAVLSAFYAHPYLVLGFGGAFFLYIERHNKKARAAAAQPVADPNQLQLALEAPANKAE